MQADLHQDIDLSAVCRMRGKGNIATGHGAEQRNAHGEKERATRVGEIA